MYHFRNRITHPDNSIAEKVNFFADYFEFTISDFGKIGNQGLENHKSLLEKISFQFNNYSSHSKKYITHYFSNRYLNKKDPIISEYYSQDWKKINELRRASKNYSIESKRTELNQKISEFIKKLDQSLFQNSLNNITSAFLCKYPLHKHSHIEIFKYNAPIIASEFAFAGFDLKELNYVFKRIFERDVEFVDNEVKTEAPLPTHLLDLKGDAEKFYEAASNYLKNRNLKQQFEGVYYLLRNSVKKRTIIFPILNVHTQSTFHFQCDNVTFSNQLKKTYVRAKANKRFSSFFSGRKKLFAKVEVIKGDEQTSINEASKLIRRALNYFNSILKSNAQLFTEDFIVCEDDICTRKYGFTKVLHENSKKPLISSDMKLHLNGIDTDLGRRLINSDRIYFQALGSYYEEEKLIHLWRYLESFFDQYDYNSEELKDKVSKILSQESIESFSFVNFNLAFQILTGPFATLGPKSFKATREEIRSLLEPGFINKVNFSRLAEIISHPYVTKQLRWEINTSVEKKIEKGYEFYCNLLFETYEQRNLLEHSGTHNEKAIQKIMLSFPDAVYKFRNILTRKAKSAKFKSFMDVVNSLPK